MTIFAIAIETHECYGHGDNGTEQRIVRMGSYGTGEFPPAFESRSEAEAWLKVNQKQFYTKAVVVPIELRSPKQPPKNKLFPIV